MILTFYGQFIFDRNLTPVAVELLVRGDNDTDIPKSPFDIFSLNEFENMHYYALDMQLISHVGMMADKLKSLSGLQHVFVNLSDAILKELTIGSDDSVPFASLLSLSKKLSPLKIVIEIHEKSRIRFDHLKLIVERLQSSGLFIAQDDFESSRQDFLGIEWDFVKVNKGISCIEKIPRYFNVVLERSFVSDIQNENFDNCLLFQGFDFHYPQKITELSDFDPKEINLANKPENPPQCGRG